MTATVVDADWVAARLGLDARSVYRGARAGQIPCRRVGRRYIFVEQAIESWLVSSITTPLNPAEAVR